jgi:FtsZ-interacting cell division protein ZipA
MELVVGIAAGTLVLIVGLWLAQRRHERTFPPELLEAMRVEKSDPARAEFLMDQYFMQGASREEAERRDLWKRAPRELAAAEELRRRLLSDLDADSEIQRDAQKSGSAQLEQTVAMSQKTIRDQIATLNEIIPRLGAK